MSSHVVLCKQLGESLGCASASCSVVLALVGLALHEDAQCIRLDVCLAESVESRLWMNKTAMLVV